MLPNETKIKGNDIMPPKIKFTKEKIVDTALDITREQGMTGLTARALAGRLRCSVKPIFAQFENMDQVQAEVMKAAQSFYDNYIISAMKEGKHPPYKASGLAYIQFAREEKELFKLLFMRDRAGENIPEDRDGIRYILDVIQEKTGLSEDDAYNYHLEMWVHIHGIAAMIATSYVDWDDEFIDRVLNNAFYGLNYCYSVKIKEEQNGNNKDR